VHIEFEVEEPSAQAALENLVSKILEAGVSFHFNVFQGKADLLNKLPGTLRGYSHWLPDDWRIVVLVDLDAGNCLRLKRFLEDAANDARLASKSRTRPGERFQVLNRLAIEELEAWFFGDTGALHRAFPRVPENLNKKAKYRDPDAIRGGTKEALERELRNRRYYPGGYLAIDAARTISQYMDPDKNESHSFQVFRDGLREMARVQP